MSKNWIEGVAKKQKSDPILVEKVVRALYLLEQLQRSELNFIFKGGTALMLLLPEPKRLSIDLDIIVSEGAGNIEGIFSRIIQDSDFIDCQIDERKNQSTIEKAHYKFYYKPVTNTLAEREYILVDILFEKSHYNEHIHEIEISSNFSSNDGEPIFVTVPVPEALLGDKLTAYAPNTTGVLYGQEKQVEIIKQLFDIGHLFNLIEGTAIVSLVFDQFAKTELVYRELNELLPNDVLEDIIQTGIVISTRGQSGVGNFDELQKGIQNIRNFIFSETFHIERAIVPASKAAYLAALIRTKEIVIKRYTNPLEIGDWLIEQPFETRLNKLKKTNPEAFFYWYQAISTLRRNV